MPTAAQKTLANVADKTILDGIHQNEVLTFFVNPCGLASRLMSIATMHLYSKMHGKQFEVIWALNNECTTPFDELYVLPFSTTSYVLEQKEVADILGSDESFFKKVHIPDVHMDAVRSKCGVAWKWTYRCLKSNGDIQDLSYNQFVSNTLDTIRSWKLLPNIQTKIDSFASQRIQPNTVGIHVRRTDRIMKKPEGKLRFIPEDSVDDANAEMLTILKDTLKQSDGVFLACDDIVYQQMLLQFFSKRGIDVHVYDHTFTTDSRRQTTEEAALIDMMLLSRCSKVLQFGPSRFSELASLIGEIELQSY